MEAELESREYLAERDGGELARHHGGNHLPDDRCQDDRRRQGHRFADVVANAGQQAQYRRRRPTG
ncbi:MAG: hypothetical protein U5O39_20195 [Gammaproteobacteria bacterium]|nr:hypothetical protein [Gammaproteobacteria bacterium]